MLHIITLHNKRNLLIGFIILLDFLSCINSTYGQKAVVLNIRSNYEIHVSKERVGNIEYYKASQKGSSSTNQIVSWKYTVINTETGSGSIQKTFVMDIPANVSDVQKTIALNKNEVISNFCLNDVIIPRIINIPNKNEIEILTQSNDGYYFPNDDVKLIISNNQDDIIWTWSESNIEVNRGKSYEFKADRTRKLTIVGIHKSSSKFRTVKKEILVKVLGRDEVINYDLNVPVSRITDTSSVRLSVDVKLNRYNKKFLWKWKINNEWIESISPEIEYKPQKYFTNSQVLVYPSFFPSAREEKSLQMQYLPGPTEYKILIPNKIFTDESILLRAVSENANPNTKWKWSINGKELKTNADTLQINYPLPNMIVSVQPELNKKEGTIKNIKLENVIVRTVMPKQIIGELKFCGVPSKAQNYYLESAILGSESSHWILYEDNIEKLRFKTNNFYYQPKKSANFYVTPNNRPDLKFSFKIDVVEIKLVKLNILGPTVECPGNPFLLKFTSSVDTSKIKWSWYRREQGPNKYPALLGNTPEIEDKIEKSATYFLEVSIDGCKVGPNPEHFMGIMELPPKPLIYSRTDYKKGKSNLYVTKGLNDDYTTEWSNDNFNTIYKEGDILENYRIKKGSNYLYARYKNKCGNYSEVGFETVYGKSNNYFFINFGYSHKKSFLLTLGNKNWYIRAKGSPSYFRKSLYPVEYYERELLISDESKVINYPQSTGTYYIVNGKSIYNRIGLSTGILLGSQSFRFYLGAGYGEIGQLWGLDIFNYSSNNRITERWAKNVSLSAKGIELEGGLYFNIGNFNIMSGASFIPSNSMNKPVFEMSFGLGFSNRAKNK